MCKGRPTLTRKRLLPLLPILLVLAAACGDGGDVRVVALTPVAAPTTAPDASPTLLPPTASTATPTSRPSVEVPARPDNPLAGGLAVAAYLAGGQADLAGCLPELVAAWNLPPIEGERCALTDITGDGLDDLLFVVSIAVESGGDPGDVWVFDQAGGQTRLISSARVLANEVLESVQLISATDLTGDTFADPVISSETCGASVCVHRFIIASAHRGSLANLAPNDPTVPSLESVRVEDVDGDGLPDIVLRGGALTTPGAGPQRSSQRIFSWNGLTFSDREIVDPPAYLFHAIVDADAAFAAADYQRARSLYDAAATTTTLRDWKAEVGEPAGRSELSAYARFRAALASLRLGAGADALVRLGRLSGSQGGTLHGQAATFYVTALSGGAPASESCAAAEAFLRTQSDLFARTWDYGFGNPEHAIADFCR